MDPKKSLASKEPSTYTASDDLSESLEETPKKNGLKGMLFDFRDGFKERIVEEGDNSSDMSDLEKANVRAAKTPLKRELNSRHIQMIAIGGAIGTGLFVGSGSALASGGPASLIICYFFTGIMIFCTIQALGELAVEFPVSGSFLILCSRFVSPAWGFAVAWTYTIQWLTLLPLELVAAAITIKFWTSISSAVWVSIVYACIVVINICSIKMFGEIESVLSLIKIFAVVGFCILGIIMDCGVPSGEYIGGMYFHNPGAFNHGFKGLCSVLVTAAFSFGGTELIGLTAAETANPRKTLPKASKQVVWRIVLIYLISLIMIGFLVPYNDSRLMNSSSSSASDSPFVIAIENAGIKVLPSIFNAIILISVVSVANSSVFACSRSVASLANQGFAPKLLGYVDRNGRPLVGIVISLLMGLLCYLSVTPNEAEVFNWLMAISGLSSVLTWGTICLSHIRFRNAMKIQGRSTEELQYTSIVGTLGSWIGLVLNVLVLIAQLWISIVPIGANPSAEVFFQNYLNVVVNLALLIGYCIWKRHGGLKMLWIPAKDIDLSSGRENIDMELLRQERAEESAMMQTKPWIYRIYKFWC
ncbi:hypothetical protein FOA43_002905 [Brettanomyces nanus]|uniref:Amino acid permease/ SLC12A domain-containing protein n=1 Tax=Eeniella nana TaxID=13502 RepID=A0A875RPW9_EENNA|nr:uncharacterized protein FOA43_002905 [Brettanomyces nanus]QPG75550.1 hypothetical protein FOA43_002905 [Brettanomyces nanus]